MIMIVFISDRGISMCKHKCALTKRKPGRSKRPGFFIGKTCNQMEIMLKILEWMEVLGEVLIIIAVMKNDRIRRR